MKAGWTNVFWIVIFGFTLLLLFKVTFRTNKSNPNTSEKILKTCQELVAKKIDVDLSNITPVIVPVGSAVQYGQMTRQELVLWKNDEFKVEVKCFARSHKTNADAVIDKLIVNGEDKTNLVRREERKE